MRLKNLPKYTEDFRLVYNKAWANHDGVVEMTKEFAQVEQHPKFEGRVITMLLGPKWSAQ